MWEWIVTSIEGSQLGLRHVDRFFNWPEVAGAVIVLHDQSY
jgi:hypothetical protein